MSAEQTAFIFFSGLSLILVLLPLPWHWSARNYGTLLYIGWTFVGNLIYFINAIVWSGNLGNPAPVWCDITAKLAMGLGVALPAVSLCINRRLYNIATMKHVSLSPKQKLYQTLIDFGIGLGLPSLVMALHYVVQGHRYDIIEDFGCAPTSYHTALVIPLVLMWPLLLGLISMVYSALAMMAFMRQRRTFNAMLNSNKSNLNVSRYLRLMALAGTDLLLDIPLSIFISWSNLHHGLEPWISWSDTHFDFSHVDYVPQALIQRVPGAWAAFTINRWALPIAAILFFLFFGLAGESVAFYRRVFKRCTSIPLPSFCRRIVSRSYSHDTLSSQTSPSSPTIASPLKQVPQYGHDLEGAYNEKSPGYATLRSVASGTTTFPVTFPRSELGEQNHDLESIAAPSHSDTPLPLNLPRFPPPVPPFSTLVPSTTSFRHSI